MPEARLLVVDDDRNLLELVTMRLEAAGYEVTAAPNEDTAIEKARAEAFDLAVVDLQLVHSDGITLMEELHLIHPGMPVIILTAYGTIESVVEAMKRGAYSYLAKPFDGRELLVQIEKALETVHLQSEINRLEGMLREKYDFSNIVAKSSKMQHVLKQVLYVAKTDSTVFIHGESGTGKELVAKAIHSLSSRKDKPFVDINCAAIPETLLESELFGYEKGAFTGALRSKAGLFTQAHGGTIFLDEIGDMSLSIQSKVLRVLEERKFYPVGDQKPIEVNVRVIVATNKDLQDHVKAGKFREDLYYRIHVIPIYIPPIRERKEDIPGLVNHFVEMLSEQMNKKVKGLTPQAMQKLMLHDWPGNVRELKNAIEYAVAMTPQDVITEEFFFQSKGTPDQGFKTLKEARESFEKSYVIHLLEMTKGNVSRAAEMAGKYRADFYNLMKKYDLDPKEFKEGR